jgi:hypothetical protein
MRQTPQAEACATKTDLHDHVVGLPKIQIRAGKKSCALEDRKGAAPGSGDLHE